jgi:hypothetical protein
MLGVDFSCYYACLYYYRMNFELSCVCVFVLGPVFLFAVTVIFRLEGESFFEGGKSAMSTPIAVSYLFILAALFYFSL